MVAMDLLNKYKKDKQFIQKDLASQKHQSELLNIPLAPTNAVKPPKINQLNHALTQAERHKAV